MVSMLFSEKIKKIHKAGWPLQNVPPVSHSKRIFKIVPPVSHSNCKIGKSGTFKKKMHIMFYQCHIQ